MTPLDPRHLILVRIHYAILGLILLGGLAAADIFWTRRPWPPAGWPSFAGVVLLILLVWLFARRRHRSWGFMRGEDELTVKHGLMVRRRTVVPFGRVQHIDIAQGPFERMLGIATLVLNTAGTRGAAVRLPGLDAAAAEELRDHVRGQIRQDLM